MMVIRRKFFSIGANAVIASALIGCGGNNNRPASDRTAVPVEGGFQTASTTLPETYGPSTQPRTVTVTIGNSVISDAVLAGNASTITPTTSVAVIPADEPFFTPVIVGGTLAQTRAPGDIRVNGVLYQGIRLLPNGSLNRPLVFAPGRYTVEFEGPFRFQTGFAGLTVSDSIVARFSVTENGVAGIPFALTSNLPANGTSTEGNRFVTFSLPQEFANSSSRLLIRKSNGDMSKTIQSGIRRTFVDLAGGAGNPLIPTSGVTSVEFDVAPPQG